MTFIFEKHMIDTLLCFDVYFKQNYEIAGSFTLFIDDFSQLPD